MQSSNEIIFYGKGNLPEKNNLPSWIERVSDIFPQDMKARFRSNMKRMVSYEWESKKERKRAMERVRAMFQAASLKMEKQAILQYQKAEDRMFYDYSKKITRVGRKMGIPVKHLGEMCIDERSRIAIWYKGRRWIFSPLENYPEALPPNALNHTFALREMGFRWNKAFIGKPVMVPRDPIFAISVGRWLLSLCRW